MQHITRKMASHYRHAYRPVHAKSHGVLVGTLEVLPNLPTELAQGLFADASYLPHSCSASQPTLATCFRRQSFKLPAALLSRSSTSPVSSFPRTTATPPRTSSASTATSSPQPDPKGFLGIHQAASTKLSTPPKPVKHAVISTAAQRHQRRPQNRALCNPRHLKASAPPPSISLAKAFSTISPLRYGNLCRENRHSRPRKRKPQGNLPASHVDLGEDYNALEEMIKHHFRKEDRHLGCQGPASACRTWRHRRQKTSPSPSKKPTPSGPKKTKRESLAAHGR